MLPPSLKSAALVVVVFSAAQVADANFLFNDELDLRIAEPVLADAPVSADVDDDGQRPADKQIVDARGTLLSRLWRRHSRVTMGAHAISEMFGPSQNRNSTPISDSDSQDDLIDLPVENALAQIMGFGLSLVGGTLYGVSAFFASYPEKMLAEEAPGWDEKRGTRWFWISYLLMGWGGASVTVGLFSGVSVPLLNAVVYSTNLIVNMLFQITFEISFYNKVMRMGTILFGVTTLTVAGLAPEPEDTVDVGALLALPAIVWQIFMLSSLAAIIAMLFKVNSYPRNSAIKQLTWAYFVGVVGSLTDNFAKINGSLEGVLFWLVLVPYMAMGLIFVSLCVSAMQGCDVAIYVPCQLCIQLCLNVITDFIVWSVRERLSHPLPYALGFVICSLAVYIAAPGIDLGMVFSQAEELRAESLSKADGGVTQFGKVMAMLGESWYQCKSFPEKEDKKTLRKRRNLIKQVICQGMDGNCLEKEDVAELVARLWEARVSDFCPAQEIVDLLADTAFLHDYSEKDPTYLEKVRSAIPEHIQPLRRRAKTGYEASNPSRSPGAATSYEPPTFTFAKAESHEKQADADPEADAQVLNVSPLTASQPADWPILNVTGSVYQEPPAAGGQTGAAAAPPTDNN